MLLSYCSKFVKNVAMQAQAFLRHFWFVICESRELKRKPLARTLLGEPLVLFRDQQSEAAVLVDRCSHRNAPLSKGWVAEGQLVCPYHGWRFDGSGSCQLVPGLCQQTLHHTRSIQAYAVHEQDGLVWASLDPIGKAPDSFAAKPSHTSISHQFQLKARLIDALENFLDGTHTHFVHAGIVRKEHPKRKAIKVIIRGHGDQVEAHYLEGKQSGIINEWFGANVDSSLGRFILPSTVELEYRAKEELRFLIRLYFTPEQENQLRVFALAHGNSGPIPSWLIVRPLRFLLNLVVKQDRKILDLQQANLQRFGGEDYTSTELDLMRPQILRLWRLAEQDPSLGEGLKAFERELTIQL